jgi:hypothetical protein
MHWRVGRTSALRPAHRFACTLLGIAAGITICGVVLNYCGQWLSIASAPTDRADAIIVLGGDYPYRINEGISLYKQDIAPEIWYTGNIRSRFAPLSTAEFAARISRSRGVPDQAVRLLATRSTWEDGKVIAEIATMRRIRAVVIVTSWYHSRRALCAIRYHLQGSGVVIYYAPTELTPYSADTWWQEPSGWYALVRESAATIYYALRYGQNPWTCMTSTMAEHPSALME